MAFQGVGRGRNGPNPNRNKRGMGYYAIKELAEKPPENILNVISNHQSGFRDVINRTELKPDWISLILVITSKACKYCDEPLNAHACIGRTSGNVDSSRLPSARLMTYLNDIRTSTFLMQCLPFVSSFITEQCPQRKQQIYQDINNILVLCKTMLVVMPNNIEQVLPVVTSTEMVVRTLRSLNSLQGADEQLEDILQETKQLCEHVIKTQSVKANEPTGGKRQTSSKEQMQREPVNNFRELSIFPSETDLLLQDSCLPKVKETGQYRSVESYLDTHFRLLREDFMRPLRQGIREYLNTERKSHEQRKLQNIRIYQNVYIKHPICTSDGISYVVSFDAKRLRSVHWDNTKRLIYGALVCLSPDSFKTIYLATVSHRDPEQLKDGMVELRFQNATEEVNQIGINQKLVMAESSAYFEAYRHVLQGLKNLRQENLPFAKYFVNCEIKIQIPQYLREIEDPTYDLSQLVVAGQEARHGVDPSYLRNVSILQKSAWPAAEVLGLDPSQEEAIYLALTNELALIQGPPGTGKTHIGFKIVKALLQNCNYWKTNGEEMTNNPILLICYTNHALDQFLEGISTFLRDGIVRVGGRSKSQILEQFMLRDLRKMIHERKDIPVHLHRNRMDAMDELDRLHLEIDEQTAAINVSTKGFLQVKYLAEFMTETHLVQLQRHSFSEWLGVKDQTVFALYKQLTSRKSNQNEEKRNEDNIREEGAVAVDDEEMEAEEDSEKIEENRVLQGIDDMHIRTNELQQRKVMARALEKIAFKFSDLTPRQQSSQRQSTDLTEVEKIMYLLDEEDVMTDVAARNVNNIWRLNMKDRWRLYRYWLKLYKQKINDDLRHLEKQYELAARRLHEVKQQEDLEIMKRAKILGMTTTAAARYQDLLQEIRPKIVIVEEAAEVLEAHIITALTAGCQQLILIGDHKQLRPNPTDYRIAEHFKLKISLFERLANNGLPYAVLELQHRMPANISKLIQHVYTQTLKDHPSLRRWSPVRGLTTNIFFIEHNKQERENTDLKSKVNQHEADYVIRLTKYLLLQGYNPGQITVLTPYTGQLAAIRRQLREKHMQGIRACAIDNFQGEENDIILVSLVRSNEEGRIGFVGDDNRICVTLSRAKQGMFLIGNSSLLSQMNNLWSKVIQSLRADGCIGPALILRCVNHNNNMIRAESASDFDKAPEGGCMKPCLARLACGHACTRMCHAYDRDHLEYQCRKRCEKQCPDGHPCHKKCFEPCGKCQVKVKKRLPRCGHIQEIFCYENKADCKCQVPCSVRLYCGHRCQRKCGEPHTINCEELVLRRLFCGHELQMKCHIDPAEISCDVKCDAYLKCGHKCQGTCGTCMEGRLHLPCQSPCKRILVCGHECKASCRENCPPCSVSCQNRCAHSICQEKCGVPCTPCVEPCAWRCKHFSCGKMCHEPCDRPRCDQPCQRELPCGHRCIGLCGEPCPNKCRICNRDELQELLFGEEDREDALFIELEDCGHIVEVSGMDRWMDMEEDESNSREAVKLKACPKCNVIIRRNMRYGKSIKRNLQLIEMVKRKMLGEQTEVAVLRSEIGSNRALEPDGMRILQTRLEERADEMIAEREVVCIRNIIQYLIRLGTLLNQVKQRIPRISNAALRQKHDLLLKEIGFMRAWVLKQRDELCEQEEQEAEREISRLYLMAQILECDIRVENVKKDVPLVVQRKYETAVKLLVRKTPLTEEDECSVKDALREMERVVPRSGLGISDDERKEIVKVMGLSRGHWYHCRNGHVYCIGECGGAMETAKCPECDAIIGGKNHRLHEGNAVATEMDGARYAAWSEQANLDNYEHNLFN